MIQTGFEKRVTVQQVIENQLPEFILSESPKTIDFLKQYYLSQEHQGGSLDIAVNLDQYLKVDNLTPEVISGETTLYSDITDSDTTVQVYSTKGFPNEYGLFKIDNEIFTYTGITTNTFTGVIRGFSGITSYRTDLDAEELLFNDSSSATHVAATKVKNLSALFLKEFYKKLKYTLTPGLEDVDFQSNLDVNNFIKEARSLYEAKGTKESFRILFNALYGVTPNVVDLEQYLPKPSSSEFLRRELVVAERISGNPAKLVGQTIRKSSDPATQGAVSEVEVFTRSGISTYYKIGLFVGYSDNALIEGTFQVQPKTKVINPAAINDSIITVDSTIGFGATGTLISGKNVVTYTDKTVNQFLGCDGVTVGIGTADEIRTDEVFVGYEDGDLTKKVEIRLGGVLSDFATTSDVLDTAEEQVLYVKHVGEKIKNPETGSTDKEIFANSWVYNTSNRFDVESFNLSSSTITLKTDEIDRSQLDIGDAVDILLFNSQNLAFQGATVANINESLRQIQLNGLSGFNYDATQTYTLRRKLKTANSTGSPIVYGNNKVTSDIQNVYNDNDEFFYVASNSIPSYNITKSTVKYTISTGTSGSLAGYDSISEKYQIISFNEPTLDFVTGDRVFYKADDGTTLKGLNEGYYFVKVLSGGAIKIYESRALIETDGLVIDGDIVNNALGFLTNGTNDHTFILANQVSDKIHPQKLLKKFPHSQDIKTGNDTKTVPGSVGMLVNGVEVISYKSLDKIHYGPIENVTVYNPGKDYDVINPPNITVAAGLGTTALVRSVVSGSVKEVLVDPQSFDVIDVKSVTISGGNGSGAILEPMVGVRQREVRFDSRNDINGGGVSLSLNTVTFVDNHNFVTGEALQYDSNTNTNLGTFKHNGIYYPEVISSTAIKLYPTLADVNSGINTIGLTTNTQGYHKFRKAEYTNTLRAIKVLDGGSGYTNRKLIIDSVGVHTVSNSIRYDNHGFGDGDLVNYSTDGTEIAGLSTANQYYIIKEDDDSFKLANAGVGGTISTNYERRYYETFTNSGVGYQNFAYPDITLTVNATLGSGGGTITATPVIRGEMVGAYLYEKGTGYGSSIINFEKNPIVTIKTGKNAEFLPIIVNGKVDKVKVTYAGLEYTSPPDLTFIGVGSGIGAKARAVIEDGKVTDVVIINPGTGYDTNTGIAATSVGSNAYIEADVRKLSVNQYSRFGNEILVENAGGLQYGYVGHSTAIASVALGDDLDKHSPIIGWAYDGNPIYGPNGYSDPEDSDSSVKYLNTGYKLIPTDIFDRPPSKIDGTAFDQGFFIEDYKFNNSGDLDEHNGRYGKTPEFPNGVYAYFAGITDVTREAKFPYYIGDTYRSKPLTQIVDQSFDFNMSDLVRNTLPYKAEDLNAGNDFITEPYETLQQRTIVDSITKGTVDEFTINQSGDGYAVNDIVVFDNEGTNGGGLNAYVSELEGKEIETINTEVATYQSATLIWDTSSQVSVHIKPTHSLLYGDDVVISGISTFIKGLAKSHTIGVSSISVSLVGDIPVNPAAGDVDDIYVSTIPTNISVGSTVAIGVTDQEIVSVLNIFHDENVLRVLRGQTGSAHTASSAVEKLSDSFTIPLVTKHFTSKLDDKVYFNPKESVGLGVTTGGDISREYTIGNIQKTISVPYQSIYIPNHPFKDNQEVTFSRVTGAPVIGVSDGPTTSIKNLPLSGDTQTLYVINKGRDHIGLTTAVGFNTNGYYFRNYAATSDHRDWKYSLESNLTQETARVEKITATVAVSTAHLLSNGDPIKLSIKSNQSVGIGTSVAIRLKYNSENDKLTINPTTFAGSAILAGNQFNLTEHDLKTGDKVFYNGTATGLSTGSYYTYRIDDNKFQLGQTRKDVLEEPPVVVSVTAGSGGSGQELSLVNPRIKTIRNNHLVFDTSDSTLTGYTVRIYHDEEFKNELVSIGGTITNFTIDRSIIASGNVGAAVTLQYSENLSSKLYYTIEKGGYISTSDTEVANNSEILFAPSVYNNSYSVAGVGTTTFQISLKSVPESLTYNQTTTSRLEYYTSSATARGGVKSLRATSGGLNYKKLPTFKSITSVDGANADIIPHSSTIGRIKEVTIDDPGFDYSADKTLRPEVFISPNITVVDRNYVISVDVISGGSGFTYAPDLVVIDPGTGVPFTQGKLEAELQGSSISKVNVLQSPRGLADTINKVFAINNTNGVGIEKIESTGIGTAIFTLTTPINNFGTQPFAVGDKVFVEGIVGIGTSGSGYNSEDNSYKFFTVEAVNPTNPVKVSIGLTDVTANAGAAVTNVAGYGQLINQNNYPTFKVNQEPLDFILDEQVAVLKGSTYVLQDLYISMNLNDQIKVRGTYDLVEGDQIRGRFSGTIALIKSLVGNSARFKVDYSLRQDKGWTDDIGKLNEDYQVLPDNDYYQNLSYTVKSPIMWEELQNPVNRLLHTTGLRNFADAGITTTTEIKGGTPVDSGSVSQIDIIGEKRVDTVSNFDFGIDLDAVANKSRFIKFQNKRLADYIDCTTNRVLSIDDIGPFFNKAFPEPNLFTNLDSISLGAGYNRYLVQAINPNNDERQVTEVITLTNKTGDIFTFEKASVGIASIGANNSYKVTRLADITGNSDTEKLVFDPINPYDNDYDIKVIKNTFNSSNVGTGDTSLGFIDITGANVNVGVGTTVTLFSATANKNEGFFANVEVVNQLTDDITYVELFVDQDGANTYMSDFYFDNTQGVNGNFIGTFGASISGGLVNVNFTNSTEANSVLVRSRVVGFGTTAVGVGTYRFLTSGQQGGTEKTARYESKFAYTHDPAGITTIFAVPKTDVTSFKSIVKVGYGNTSALHQLLGIQNSVNVPTQNVYTTQFPFLSIGSTSGIGTFGYVFNGSNTELRFYSDPGINEQVLLQSYTELIQTETDALNIPSDHLYGTIKENVITSAFNGINGGRVNQTEFDVRYNGTPIYSKAFNPADTSKVSLSSGTFTIKDHFFETNEELVYTPVSTFSNVTAAAMVMSNGSVLPTTVYAKRVTNDEFQLSLTSGGAAITFNTAGAGNAHTLTMKKRAEKTVLSLDGIVQNPITYTPVSYTLTDNFGSISATDEYVSLSGISSVLPGDILKIDNEFTKVKTVGLGTTAVGPISESGTYNLVQLERGFVGTAAASHNDAAVARIYLGSYNIIDSKLHFTDPPTGNNISSIDPETLLAKPRSTFGGRVYLRQDYTHNKIYDNISKSFTGIGATYGLTVEGTTATGIETGSGLVLINNMFQTPTTSNNVGNTYDFIDGNTASKVRFSGITTDGSNLVISDYDVNINQLPRGGMIVSLGSSLGIGYAQPVGATDIDVVINSSGALTKVGIGTTTKHGSGYRGVVGIGVTDEAYEHRWVTAANNAVNGNLTPTDGSYDSFTGLLTLTIPSHGLASSGNVTIANNSISMTCSRDNYASTKTYPRPGIDPAAGGANRAYTRIDSNAISVDVGSGGGRGTGATVTATVGVGGTLAFAVSAGGSNYKSPRILAPSPSYESLEVVGVSRLGIGMTTDTGRGLLLDLDVGPASAIPQSNKHGDTADLIDKNNAFISEVAARRMFNRWNNGSNSSYSYPSGFTEADCIDDVEDVLEATAHNIRYGGNDKTYDAANLFVTGVYSNPAPVTGEEEQVIYALHEARDMAQRALRNEKIYTHLGAQYAHTYTSGTVANAICSGGNYAHTYIAADSSANAINGSLKPTAAVYDAVAGTLALTFGSAHGIANNGNVTIANHSLVFTCARDGHATKHAYPRATDPASGNTLTATVTSTTQLTVTVGTSPLVFKSVVAGAGAEATSYDAKTGDLVLNIGSNHGLLAPTTLNAPTAATYAPSTGVLRLTITGHGCAVGDYIKIDDNSIVFTCAKDNHTTQHSYPLSRSSVSDTWLPIHQVSTNRIWVNVGKSPDTSAHTFVSATAGVQKANAGIGIGTSKLGFKCTRDANAANPGGVAQQLYPRPGDPFSWNKKQISIASTTTSSITVNVGVSSTSQTSKQQTFDNTITVDTADPKCATQAAAVNTLVGIVTNVIKTHNAAQLPTRTISSFETYQVNDFKISRPGYGFKKGDVFEPVGLVTDAALTTPSKEFSLTVLETFTDNFASWQFGELDYIDSIKDLQNGKRVRFPLQYNGDLLSFESSNPEIDLNSVLLIFVDGVIQHPGKHYTFDGGTSFIFVSPPEAGSSVSVFFYRGTRGVDSAYVNIDESIKVGDDIQLKTTGAFKGQEIRTVSGISSSDKVQTNLYTGMNIDEVNYRLLDWSKQKVDKQIEGVDVYKSRDSIEGLVYPTAKIIGDLPTTGISSVYVDDAHFFNYEENESSIVITQVGGLIIQNSDSVAAAVTATVSAAGTISALTVVSGGSGYIGSAVTVSIARPVGSAVTFVGGVGVYTGIATATIPVVDGSLSGTANITSIGVGYTHSTPPNVLVPIETVTLDENITGITTIHGFSGIVTGITTSHNGSECYINFMINKGDSGQNITNDLKPGYPILITGTNVGHGVTSIEKEEASVVAVGTTFIDNVYKVDTFTRFDNNTGKFSCRVKSGSNIAGVAATAGVSTSTIGRFSWGVLQSNDIRSNGVGIAVTGNILSSGISTFPTIQRREFGLRSNGALRKDLG